MIWKIKQSQPKKILNAILESRGFKTEKKIKDFFQPLDPQSIKLSDLGINQVETTKAVKRIKAAIKNQELIYIYGDYDTDGVCSTAILWEALNALGAKVMPYIPVRIDPIRGLSPQGIESLKDKPSLIITVDNGISAFKGCQAAKNLGIDVIITDHHQPKTKNSKACLPQVLAIVHTTQLAGAGVAWFFAREILKHLKHLRGVNIFHLGGEESEDLLDLAAIGTIADMVPLLDANRSLAKYGLEKLRVTHRFGLQALAKIAAIDLPEISEHQVSFILGPRLNAMGRMGHALDSLRLVCTKDKNRSGQLAGHLNEINQLRQDKTVSMFLDAQNKLLKIKIKPALIFVADKTYHEGIVGLVAGKLAEKFHRPALVAALGENYFKASIRSIKGFNAIESIRSLESFLLEHGGHELAAGFTADNKNLKILQSKLENLAKKSLSKKDLEQTLQIDCEIKLSDITENLFKEIEQFRPFGFSNSQPIFCTKKVKLISFRSVGQENKHLKLKLGRFEGIAFGFGYLADKLKPGQLVNVAYTLDKNEWNGQKSLQLKIKDITINI